MGGVPAPTRSTQPDSRPDDAGDRRTILIVEDEEKIRLLVRLVLEKKGFAVHPAENAVQALAIAGAFTGPPDLLLTDVVMPGLSGRELCDALRERWPVLPVLFMSGYTGDALVNMRPSPARTGFLAKPFTPMQLLEQVDALLAPAADK